MRCLIYARISTDDQTIENQLSQLKEYANQQQWDIVDVKKDICSGSRSAKDRTGLNQVFESAYRKKFDVLLFWSLDRFSREGSRKTLEYLTRLDVCGVKWHSYTEEYISSLGIFADAIISLMACLAKQERVRISERTKAGLDRLKSKGIKLGRPESSPNLREKVEKLRGQGLSLSKIACELGISKTRVHQLLNNSSLLCDKF